MYVKWIENGERRDISMCSRCGVYMTGAFDSRGLALVYKRCLIYPDHEWTATFLWVRIQPLCLPETSG